MISGIRIYSPDGVLKEEIPKEKALELYNETNKEDWYLSPTERKHWDNMITKESKPYEKKGLRPWIKRTHKITKKYNIKCIVCHKEVVKSNKCAKYCGHQCYRVSQRKSSWERYQRKKGVSTS
tara:strand:+ start:13381 stop:13749 length:369 start_codon:yes stop_codon:yes gene_type:complete